VSAITDLDEARAHVTRLSTEVVELRRDLASAEARVDSLTVEREQLREHWYRDWADGMGRWAGASVRAALDGSGS
jgi:hypothetical protein